MRLEQTLAVIIALLFASDRAHGQANTLLDPALGPQPATGFKISVPPATITASFTFSPSGGSWPLTVQFVDTTQGGPASWAWDFGDGGTSTSQNPLHVFTQPSNTFTIQLTATGPGGSSSVSHTLTTTNAIPVNVTLSPLDNVLLSSQSGIHIKWNGTSYGGFVERQGPNGSQLYLFLYDPQFHTNLLTLTGLTTFNAGASCELEFIGNDVFVIGTGTSGGQPRYSQFTLGTQTPLPTTITPVTNFLFGDDSCRVVALTKLFDNSLAIAISSITDYVANVSYRSPSGAWTNYGMIPVAPLQGGSFPFVPAPQISSAQMSGSNSNWWTFSSWDSKGVIQTGEWSTTNGLSLIRAFTLCQWPAWGVQSPYGEVEYAEAVTDLSSNRVLVTYNNFDSFDCGDPIFRSTHLVVCGLIPGVAEWTNGVGQIPDTNHFYLLSESDQFVYREGSAYGQSQVGANRILSYVRTDPCGTNANNPLELRFMTESSVTNSISPFLCSGYYRLGYAAHHKDVIFLNAVDNLWHLLSYP